MKVPCADIAKLIKQDLTEHVSRLKKQSNKTPKLATILIGESPEQLAVVATKRKLAKDIGIEFDLVHLKTEPTFLQFANILKDKAADPTVNAVTIEQPVPVTLQSDTIYNFIPVKKEIEGHRKKAEFLPPVGLTIVSLLKYIYQNTQLTTSLYPDLAKDPSFFKQTLKQKRVVLVGRGSSGGLPIAQVLSQFRINFINVNSTTYDPEQYYKDADIIVTAAGSSGIFNAKELKPGVVLINVGLHFEKGELAGDYEEKDVKSIASFYTQPKNGTLPINALFLFKNLVDAATLQYA